MALSDPPSASRSSADARAPAAGPHEGPAASWLAVEAGSGHYLLALGDTGEIFPWTAPQPVPHTVAWFLGVANLRGALYGVVRLEAFADADADPQVRPARRPGDAMAPSPSRLVALHPRFDVNCALQVDRVIGLRGAELFQPVADAGPGPDAAPGEAPAWRVRTCIDVTGTRWQALDLQALARHPRFLSVGT